MVSVATAEPERVPPATTADLPSWAAARSAAIRAERRDAATNRRRILDAARRLFAARGVDAVTMYDIARAAGVGQGTLYRRYPHKGRLSEELLEESMYALYQETAAALAEDRTNSALGELGNFLARLIRYTEENAPLLSAVADAACGERRDEWYTCPTYRWQHDTIAALLGRAVESREAAPLDVCATADFLLAPCKVEVYLIQRDYRGFSTERIIAGLRRLVAGLRVPAPRS